MPSSTVTKYECDRCTRTWYSNPNELRDPDALELKVAILGEKFEIKYGCLCTGCQKTVTDLAKQIAKVMTKSAPVRGAKKKAEEEGNAPNSASSVPPTSAAAPTDGKSAVAPPAASGAAKAAPAAVSSLQHPKR